MQQIVMHKQDFLAGPSAILRMVSAQASLADLNLAAVHRLNRLDGFGRDPVLLLPRAGAEPCRVTTGERGIPDAGTEEVCTALVGAESCAAPMLALVGTSRASFSSRPLVPLGADRLRGLGTVVRASGVLEALVEATLKMGGPPTTDGIEALPESAHVIPGMEEGPVFVRFMLKGGAKGPIVVVSDGKASGPFESL